MESRAVVRAQGPETWGSTWNRAIMTTEKHLKDAARALQEATGRSYQEARRAVLAQEVRAAAAPGAARGRAARLPAVDTTPGWHQHRGKPVFVHANGAIGAAGAISLITKLDAVFSGMTLPPPVDDPTVLREAWKSGVEPLLELPPRIVAPLLGITMWTTVCGRAPHVTHLVGPSGAGKTSVARAVAQLLHPGLVRGAGRQMMASATSSTTTGLTRTLRRARNTVLVVDDFGPAEMASTHQSVVRAATSSTGYTRLDDLERNVVEEPPAAGAVITIGEFATVGSAAARCLEVAVLDGDLDALEVQQRTGNLRGAAGRGLVGSSFLMWAAGRLDELVIQVRDEASGRGGEGADWAARLAGSSYPAGIRARIADGVATLSAGIWLLLAWAASASVLTSAEAEAVAAWATQGLHEVATGQARS